MSTTVSYLPSYAGVGKLIKTSGGFSFPPIQYDFQSVWNAEDWGKLYQSQPVTLQPIIDYDRIIGSIVETLRSLLSDISAAIASIQKSGKTVFIATLAPEPYVLKKLLPVYLESDGDSVMATFFDANISISSETEDEAFDDLKSIILDTFDCLDAEPPAQLGPEPLRQLAVLRDFIGRANAA
jgi:hypothetical protein